MKVKRKANLPDHAANVILALGRIRAEMPDTWRRLAVELAIFAIFKEYRNEHENNLQSVN